MRPGGQGQALPLQELGMCGTIVYIGFAEIPWAGASPAPTGDGYVLSSDL
jgi:hypothetical protein